MEYTKQTARQCGAQCDRCAFSAIRAHGFVPPEFTTRPIAAVVAEAPGGDEVAAGQPLVGKSGQEAMKALKAAGLKRTDVHLTNAVLCLDGASMVRMADGSIRRIGELVANNVQANVLSVDETNGELVSAPITGWHRSPIGARKMYRVLLHTAKGNPRGPVGVTVTEDHTFLTMRGWVAAKDLTSGDLVAVGEPRMFGITGEVFTGTMLGDATIQRRRLSFSHVYTNEDYVKLKMGVFSHFSPGIHTKPERFEASINSTIKPQVAVDLPACQSIGVHQDRWYPNGKKVKVVPKTIQLTPLTLAVWFMDDGYMRIREGRRPLAELATNGFSEDDVATLVGMLTRDLGLEAYYRDASGWRIYFDVHNSDELAKLIAPYVPASMQYKLPEQYREQFDESLWRVDCAAQTMWSPVSVELIEGYKQKTVYCIDVGGTHNFVTLGGVVHNCRPAGNRMDKVRADLKKVNAEREEQGKEKLLHPVEACRPRLFNELKEEGVTDIIAMGGVALEAVTQTRQSIQAIRGAPLGELVEHPEWKVFPTLHPAFVLRAMRWRHVFYGDVARAFRYFNDQLNWQDPKVIYKPSVSQIRRFLSKFKNYVVDVETDAKEPLIAKLRCVGVSTKTHGIVIPFLSVDGMHRFYTQADEREIRGILRAFLLNPEIQKTGHNLGYYDELNLGKELGIERIINARDTILIHRSVESEMPHNLAYCGSVYTDINRPWKSEHTAVTAKTDQDLWDYNITDCAVNARIEDPLTLRAKEREQWPVVELDHQLQQVCVDMHRAGMLVDMNARDKHDKQLLADAIKYRRICRDAIDNAKFNPASVLQIRDLLYDDWQLPVLNRTQEGHGDPSTDDETIRSLMLEPGLTSKQRQFLVALRMFRRRSKLRGTYIVKLKKMGQIYRLDEFSHDEDEEDWDGAQSEEAEWRKRDEKKQGIIYADGCVRSSWNVHGTNTGRFSSSGPNLQNLPRRLRDIFIPGDGFEFIYADMDQLELRLITAFSGAAVYTQVFKDGGDPHSTSTLMVMGDPGPGRRLYDEAVKLYGSAKKARKVPESAWARACDFGKRFVYAAGYWAELETILNVIRSAENDKEELIYADMDITKMQMAYDCWIGQNPEIPKWWQSCVDKYRERGYSLDWMTGRRCDFADGENKNQIVNYDCQSTGAGIVNTATLEFVSKFPANKFGKGTGLIQQGHDALLVRTPTKYAEATRKLLERCMNKRVPNLDMEFTASAKILRADEIDPVTKKPTGRILHHWGLA